MFGLKPKLSIVIPVYNEEKNIPILNKRITEALDKKIKYEVIWIDDGSADKTSSILEKICEEDKQVHGITLMTRSGQSSALMAGIDKAQGEYIATMDGDNQDDPKDFLKMITKLEKENLDVVVGWRKNRWEGNFIRRIPSLIANKLMKMNFGDLGIHDTGCMVKVAKSEIIKNVRLYGELHRFMSYLLGMYGAKMGEIPVHHQKRIHGKSKYGFKRTLTVMFDILNVKFLTMKRSTPIQFMGPMALLTYLVGLICGIYIIIDKLVSGADITGSPLFLITILAIIMGTQFLSFGLLGELVLRTYYENGHNKTVYAIRKTY
ncbi:MAG: glycosyltransferase family 2 protein [Candidatus Dojkabacteria bacterium]|nr:glycosyltransferase family 2 protein [Candidatus Dojkabacteria bacterium]